MLGEGHPHPAPVLPEPWHFPSYLGGLMWRVLSRGDHLPGQAQDCRNGQIGPSLSQVSDSSGGDQQNAVKWKTKKMAGYSKAGERDHEVLTEIMVRLFFLRYLLRGGGHLSWRLKTREAPPCGSCWKSDSGRRKSLRERLRPEQRGLGAGGQGV